VIDNILIDNETLLVTDFVNLKIKPIQSFECAHRGRVCVSVFIRRVHIYIYMSIYVYTMFLKKKKLGFKPYRNNYTMESFETKD
jgi:hypothetical protein